MLRTFDIGGAAGLGPVPGIGDRALHGVSEQAFHHEWEARVFVLNRLLLESGLYNLDEFRYAIERMPPREYAATSYYERWLVALERLLLEKGVLP
jgi:nitrile hydratase